MNIPGYQPENTNREEKPVYDRRPIITPPYTTDKPDPLPAWGYALPPEVAEKYDIVTILARKYDFKNWGEIDLRRITIDEADDLHRRGFPFLKEKLK